MRQSHEKAMEEFRLECSKEKEQAEAGMFSCLNLNLKKN